MTSVTKSQAQKEKRALLPDYGIAKLSCMGMLGFVVGLFLLYFSDYRKIKEKQSIFHEISYNPRTIIDSLFITQVTKLKQDIVLAQNAISLIKQSQKKPDNPSKKIDSLQIDSLEKIIKYDTTLLGQISSYKNNCGKMADSTAFKTINFALCTSITSDSIIYKWDTAFKCNPETWHSDSINIIFRDSKIDEELKGKFSFSMIAYKFDIDFLTKYPLVGIWLLLILSFFSFCFMAVPIAIELRGKVLKIFIEHKVSVVARFGYYWVASLILLALLTLLLLWLTSFYDKTIIKDIFFMCNLSNVIGWMTFIGTVSGSFCLAGFIYTSSMLSYFCNPLLQTRKETVQQKETLSQLQSSTQEDGARLNDEQLKLNEREKEQAIQEMRFKRLSNIFQTYFILAASILSIMVLCTGTLFSATNSLDFIKLLADDWGYSPVRNDFVYLYGGLYTIILLMVYVPAKMKFSDSEIDLWNATPLKDTDQKRSFLKNPFDQFKGLLVAVSPLVVSVVQSLLDLLFQ